MERKLFTVEDSFTISGRGIVLLPGLTLEDYARVPVGSAIELRRPDGTCLRTTLSALAYPPSIKYTGPAPEKRTSFVHLPPEVKKEEVPVGTEVFLIDAASHSHPR